MRASIQMWSTSGKNDTENQLIFATVNTNVADIGQKISGEATDFARVNSNVANVGKMTWRIN